MVSVSLRACRVLRTETLMFHYLRYLRFTNVSTPKKILAVRLVDRLAEMLRLE